MNTKHTKLYTCGSASGGLRTATRARNTKYEIRNTKDGFVLPLVLVAIVILMALIIGATMTGYGSRIQAVQTKSQTEAMLAAEAGYEQAIFWMSQRTDLLGDIADGNGVGSINFETGRCDYEIGFHGFIGARPVFRVTSTGVCGRPSFTRVVDVDVMQETSGWAMGSCRVPSGTTSTTEVYFKNGEIVDIPLHINKYSDSPDVRDIWITGHPRFLRKVEMGESRKAGSTDKYGSTIISYFEDGITFDQPGIRITDEAAVTSKINRFRNSTAAAYKFTPTASTSVTAPRYAAVQLEFYVTGGIGYVKITKNCTVKGLATGSVGPYDYNVVPGYSGTRFQKYSIYQYHFAKTETPVIARLEEANSIYVSQTIGGYTSDKGGQIFVNGNVVIGSCDYTDMIVKGKITVVATGNIWIADSIKVDDNGGTQRDANGMPKADNPNSNPNVLGLIAQGVIKIVDPGQSPSSSPSPPSGYTFVRVCNGSSATSNTRYLPDPTVVETAMTVGGGGFGAEYVGGGSSGRKEFSGNSDDLIVRGSITEVIRGVVNLGDPITDGYAKNYHIDTRLMSGILPGDIWFSGKYIPAPAGWHDHSAN
jgi:hypothetical protein